MSQTAPTKLCTVVIEGLRKVENVEEDDGWWATKCEDSGLYRLSVKLREDDLVWPGLWQKIEACGFGVPRKLVYGGVEYEKNYPVTVVREHDEVLVVADDQASSPTKIKMNETLISHTNTHHVPPVEFHADTESVKCERTGFSVSFERTTRIPDDNKLHHLPPSLGRFQLFSVDKYSKHLPKNVTETGGVFFSMWQREAMWLNFEPGSRNYAVRVFVGRINAITGQEMQSEQDAEKEEKLQDYIVTPGQRWLDGICVAPGVVRQFVAMPLGSGYTVEGQKTSEEKHGGLQLEVTPPMEHGKRSWSYAKEQHIVHRFHGDPKTAGLHEGQTPSHLGCKVGDVLKSYPTEKEFKQPFQIQDLLIQEAGSLSITLKAAGDIWAMPPPILKQPRSRNSQYTHSKGPQMVNDTPHTPSSAPPRRRPVLQEASIQAAPIQAAPIQAAPIQAAPIQAAPIQAAPIQAAPIQAAPIEEASIQRAKLPPPSSSGFSDGRPSYNAALEFHSLPSHWRARGSPDLADCGYSGLVEEEFEEAAVEDSESGNKDETDLMELTEAQAKNVKTLGLAAGGKLIQDIYKDPFPATTWNHAGARILHVHMVDPESCEKVTHIVPQPPPMAVEDYVKSGGQFYVVEEKVDDRIDGGDFDNVKSVSQMDQHVGITTEPEFDPKRPKMCTTCERRLCDCIIRPCNHQFCNVCIKRLEEAGDTEQSVQQANHWKCPTCNSSVSRVAGFSAPMNLPGEERLLRTKVPVAVLKIEDGRTRFSSMQTSRV